MLVRSVVAFVLVLLNLLPGHIGAGSQSLLAPIISSHRNKTQPHLVNPLFHTWVPQPTKTAEATLSLGAASIYALDLDSAKVLYGYNSGARRPIASITKLITAMVILRSHKLDEIVTVPALRIYNSDDAKIGLVAGQKLRLGDLLSAALIPSANDAADALAIYDAGSLASFAAKMNQLTKQWGIEGANFTSANGLNEQDNNASAEALAKLAKIALANPAFTLAVGTISTQISDLAGHNYNLVTTNHLLSSGRFSGLKTGFTAAAGQSLVGLTTIQGHKVITVVLNSPDRFGETTTLANWIDQNYAWQ